MTGVGVGVGMGVGNWFQSVSVTDAGLVAPVASW